MRKNKKQKETPYIRVTLSSSWTIQGNYMGNLLDKDRTHEGSLIKKEFFQGSKELRENLRLKVRGNEKTGMSFNLVANKSKLDQVTDAELYLLPHVIDVQRHLKAA